MVTGVHFYTVSMGGLSMYQSTKEGTIMDSLIMKNAHLLSATNSGNMTVREFQHQHIFVIKHTKF